MIKDILENDESRPYGKSKLMFVGQGRAGKTSCIKSLMGKDFDPSENSTKGFEVIKTNAKNWEEYEGSLLLEQLGSMPEKTRIASFGVFSPAPQKDVEPKGRRLSKKELKMYGRNVILSSSKDQTVSFSIWDFGGQRVFYSLHHLFLTEYGCYALVFNTRALFESDGSTSSVEYLRFWLFSKKIHAPKAPILMIGTHCADCSMEDLKTVNNILKRDVLGKKWFNLKRNGELNFFPIDNSSGEGIEDLKKKIDDVSKRQQFIKQEVPISFLRLNELLGLTAKPCLAVAEASEVATKCGLEAEDFHAALAFLNERGVLNYFTEHESLRDVIILDPQWLVGVLTDVIYDEEHHEDPLFDDALEDDFQRFRDENILSHELIQNIWDQKKEPRVVQQFLISLMKRSCLMANYAYTEEPSFLIPSLFTADITHNSDSSFKLNGYSFMIDFSGEYDTAYLKGLHVKYIPYIPYGFFERMVCLCVRHGESLVGSGEPILGDRRAEINFGDDFDFELHVVKDESARPLRIRVATDENKDPGQFLEFAKLIYGMAKGISADIFSKHSDAASLALSLLIPSSQDTGLVYANFFELEKLFKASKTKNVKPNKRRSEKISSTAFSHWFEDIQQRKLSGFQAVSAGGIAYAYDIQLREGLRHHCFLSHRQATAEDITKVLSLVLKERGLKCWYDRYYKEELNSMAMREGIAGSLCYVLILSRDVFEGFVVEELKTALELKKPIILLHHPDTGCIGYCSFGDYIESLPKFAEGLFANTESLHIRRKGYEEAALANQIVQRVRHFYEQNN